MDALDPFAPKLLTVPEAAEIAHVNLVHMYHLVARGRVSVEDARPLGTPRQDFGRKNAFVQGVPRSTGG